MSKWIILSLFVFSATLYAPSEAYARRSSSHGHSHGRTPRFQFPLPSYKSHSRPANPAPTYNRPIYVKKGYPLPRIYSLEKPLVDDPAIYRPLNIRRQTSRMAFYRYDEAKDQYIVPRVLHADTKDVLNRRSMSVEINGQVFYYRDGFFYKKDGEHIIVAPPVINSVVETIPKSSTNVGISGNHYEHNGIYFKKLLQGYQVVGRPSV